MEGCDTCPIHLLHEKLFVWFFYFSAQYPTCTELRWSHLTGTTVHTRSTGSWVVLRMQYTTHMLYGSTSNRLDVSFNDSLLSSVVYHSPDGHTIFIVPLTSTSHQQTPTSPSDPSPMGYPPSAPSPQYSRACSHSYPYSSRPTTRSSRDLRP